MNIGYDLLIYVMRGIFKKISFFYMFINYELLIFAEVFLGQMFMFAVFSLGFVFIRILELRKFMCL